LQQNTYLYAVIGSSCGELSANEKEGKSTLNDDSLLRPEGSFSNDINQKTHQNNKYQYNHYAANMRQHKRLCLYPWNHYLFIQQHFSNCWGLAA